MNQIGNSGGRGRIRLGGDGDDLVRVDGFNLALIMMDEIHSNIHRGIMYAVTDLFQALGNGASEEIYIATSGVIHMRITTSASAQSLVRFYEDTVVSDPGSGLPSRNRNRITSNVSERATFYRGPTVTDGGTLLSEGFVPGGEKNQADGSSASTFHEWILPSGNYLFVLTNNSGGNEDGSVEFDYYEPS